MIRTNHSRSTSSYFGGLHTVALNARRPKLTPGVLLALPLLTVSLDAGQLGVTILDLAFLGRIARHFDPYRPRRLIFRTIKIFFAMS